MKVADVEDRTKIQHPNQKNFKGYRIWNSSNVRIVMWDTKEKCMVIWFKNGGLYRYDDVPYQRVVACALAPSVGKYVQQKIKPNYKKVVKLA